MSNQFTDSDLDSKYEAVEDLYDFLYQIGKLEKELIDRFGKVKLWVLRGEGKSDFQLLYMSMGYNG